MQKEKHISSAQPTIQLLAFLLLGAGLLLAGTAALAYLAIHRNELGNTVTAPAVPVSVNFPAPALSLNDLNGKSVSLSDLHGRYVLVNSWATWCPPCQQEMPDLEKFYQAHKDQNFTIVAIEDGEPKNEVAQFVQKYQLSFTVLLDPQGLTVEAFKNPGLPTSWLIDPQGTVVMTWQGAIDRKTLEEKVAPLLQNSN